MRSSFFGGGLHSSSTTHHGHNRGQAADHTAATDEDQTHRNELDDEDDVHEVSCSEGIVDSASSVLKTFTRTDSSGHAPSPDSTNNHHDKDGAARAASELTDCLDFFIFKSSSNSTAHRKHEIEKTANEHGQHPCVESSSNVHLSRITQVAYLDWCSQSHGFVLDAAASSIFETGLVGQVFRVGKSVVSKDCCEYSGNHNGTYKRSDSLLLHLGTVHRRGKLCELFHGQFLKMNNK